MKKIITFSSAALTALSLVAIVAPAFADTGAVTNSVSSTTSTTGVTFTAPENALALDSATDFYFGVNEIDGKPKDFKALTKTDSPESNSQAFPLVAFHDLDGVSKNYAITATARIDGLDSSTITLDGASFSNISYEGATDITALTNDPTNYNKHTLIKDDPQVIVKSTGQVSGYYVEKFSNVTLTVPVAEQTTSDHKGTITWALTFAPL